jgi:hypothetical protein
MESAEDARLSYRKRFRIETFFSGEKRRGFNLHESRIPDPGRSVSKYWKIDSTLT